MKLINNSSKCEALSLTHHHKFPQLLLSIVLGAPNTNHCSINPVRPIQPELELAEVPPYPQVQRGMARLKLIFKEYREF